MLLDIKLIQINESDTPFYIYIKRKLSVNKPLLIHQEKCIYYWVLYKEIKFYNTNFN